MKKLIVQYFRDDQDLLTFVNDNNIDVISIVPFGSSSGGYRLLGLYYYIIIKK